MNERTSSGKEFGRTILGALAAILVSTLLFNLLTESGLAAELGKTQMIPTNYPAAPALQANLPEGYQKASYTVVPDPLCKDKPTTKDLTMEAAAELGAQAIWEVLGIDMQDATVYMGYNIGGETFPRATWTGDVRFGARDKPDGTPRIHGYSFTLDAVTGERFNLVWSRTLSAALPLGLDLELANNPQEYMDLARALAEKHKLVGESVRVCEYGGQGYSDNDPVISIRVTGTNGEAAILSFSRYDQKFQGVIYPESLKIGEAASEKLQARLEKQMEEQRKNNPRSSPGLVAVN